MWVFFGFHSQSKNLLQRSIGGSKVPLGLNVFVCVLCGLGNDWQLVQCESHFQPTVVGGPTVAGTGSSIPMRVLRIDGSETLWLINAIKEVFRSFLMLV